MRDPSPRYTLVDALEGVVSLLNPGPYGIADDDPKAEIIRDLDKISEGLKIRPVIIGGIAVILNGHPRHTIDVDLLVARDDALKLIDRLKASREFTSLDIDRFRHNRTRAGLDLCVEGELTSPRHVDRFPSPASVQLIPRDPLPVVDLKDLMALKAKSARVQDEADFVRLFISRGLEAGDVQDIKQKIEDRELREMVDRWHARALEEIEREKLRRPPNLD
jgi:hypothetical protein